MATKKRTKRKAATKARKVYVAFDLSDGHYQTGDTATVAVENLYDYCGNYDNPVRVVELRFPVPRASLAYTATLPERKADASFDAR